MDPIVSPAGPSVLSRPGKYHHLDRARSQVCFLGRACLFFFFFRECLHVCVCLEAYACVRRRRRSLVTTATAPFQLFVPTEHVT